MMLRDSAYEFNRKTYNHTAHKAIQGIHSYDILASPLYRSYFQYVDADEPDRNKFIIDGDDDESNDAMQSDIIRVALYSSFATANEAKYQALLDRMVPNTSIQNK